MNTRSSQLWQWWKQLTPAAAFCYLFVGLVVLLGILGLLGLDPAPLGFAVLDLVVAVPLFFVARWIDRHAERMVPKVLLLGIVTAGSLYGMLSLPDPMTQIFLSMFPSICGIAIFGTFHTLLIYPLMLLIRRFVGGYEITGLMIVVFLLLYIGWWSVHREARLKSASLLAKDLQLHHEQQVTQFLRAIQHELGNYVSALQGFGPVLSAILAQLVVLSPDAHQERHELHERFDHMVSVHGKTTENLRLLTQQMLVVSRELTPLTTAQLSVVDVDELLTELKTLGDAYADYHGLNVDITVAAQSRCIRAQPEYLRMALSTALRNAQEILSTAPAGRITLSAEDCGAFVRFVVEDSGPGFPRYVLEHSGSLLGYTTKRRSGMGIGLTLIERVARMHRGRAVFTNGIVGGRVELSLPRA